LFNPAGTLIASILLIRKKLHPFLIQPDASTASTRDPGLAQTFGSNIRLGINLNAAGDETIALSRIRATGGF
jgi:hypothetical protein